MAYSNTRSNSRSSSRRSSENKIVDTLRDIADTVKDRSQGTDVPLKCIIGALIVVGLVMMYSASYAYAYYYQNGNSNYYITRQLAFAVFGAVAMFLVSFFPAERLKDFTLWILGLSYVLLIIVLFLPEINYVHRWINLGFTTLQPSEITKFAIILFGATWVTNHYNKIHTFKWGVAPFLVVLGSTCALLIMEPHISCTVLVILIAMTMMWVGGVDFKWFAILAVVAVFSIIGIILSGIIGYSSGRIAVWRDPTIDPLGKGWQNIQALYAISSGGLLGQGLGNSRQKYLYISEPQNDFIFSVVCEELGFVGAVLIIALFLALIWRGFTISMSTPDRFSKLLGIGITAQVGWQALLNIAVVTKVIPNTGISLPFFSYGGTSLVMLMLEMGVLLSISRHSTIKKI